MAAELHGLGVQRGDVVLTLAGNQPDWVVAMVACFRQGYVVLPCTEQLRAKDLRLRLDVTQPAAVVADRRNAEVLAEAGWDGPTIWGPGVMDRPAPAPEDVPPAADLAPLDPCLITFTSGTAGEPKAVLHGQRYLDGQQLQAEHWLVRPPRRPRLVHRRQRLEQVGAQRLHRAVAAWCCGAAARRALRSRPSASTSSSASASRCCAWRRPSTA